MLAEFSRLVGTLNRRIPATERGILFSDPTRLQNEKNLKIKMNHLQVFTITKQKELQQKNFLPRDTCTL